MPSAPIIERIALNVFDTLKGVTTEAGYSISLIPQRRKLGNGNNPAHGLCVIWQGSPTVDELTTGAPLGAIFRRVTFALQVYLIQSERADEAIDTIINYAIADIETAIMADPSRGDHAHDTILGEPEFFDEGENGYPGVVIPFDVQYGHLMSDPTTTI